MNQRTPSDPRLARLAGLMAARYAFLSQLGAGGSGTVYEVRNLSLDRREALKVLSGSLLDEGASERFAHEARIAASLDHPGIVKIHNFGREEGIHWYSMALVEGPTLADLVERGPALDASMLAAMLMPVLEALAFSHGRGVIHRDIKPANILFDLEGHPYLTDFGIAKSEESVLRTHTGMLMGTPAYVSPEQALGEKVDARADQYSLGITIYKALTGRLPFTSDSMLQALVLRLKEDPEPLERHRPDLGPELSRIIMRAMARDRDKRWPGIAEMQAALAEVFAGMDLHPSPTLLAQMRPAPRSPLPDMQVTASHRPPERGSFEPTAELPQSPPPRRFKTWHGAAGLAAVAGLVWLLVSWSRQGAPTPAQKSVEVPASPESLPGGTVTTGPAPRLQSSASNLTTQSAALKPAAPPVRRAVVYPQLLEGAPVPALPAASDCAGLRVNLSLVVAEDGSVKRCRVLSSIPPDCAEAAKALALRYRFKPALDAQGLPLETTIAAAVDFPEKP